MKNPVFINDTFVPEEEARIHFNDLAIQRGYGIFDFFKVWNKIPVYLNDHLDRLYHSAQKMRLPLTGRSKIESIVYELINAIPDVEYGIRITLTGGNSPDGLRFEAPNLIISPHFFEPVKPELFSRGIKLITYPHQRQLPQVKTIDYIMALWLQPYILDNKADDVLYFQNDIISECPRSNFFIISNDDKIITPAEHILPGITRKKIIENIKDQIQIEERTLTLKETYAAKGAFITSTTKSVLPVSQIDHYVFPKTNFMYSKLKEVLSDKIHT